MAKRAAPAPRRRARAQEPQPTKSCARRAAQRRRVPFNMDEKGALNGFMVPGATGPYKYRCT